MNGDLAHLLLQENPDALVLLQPDGHVREWTAAAEAIFGYAPQEAVGQPLARLIVPADRPDDLERALQAARANGLTIEERVCRRKDGSLVYVSVSTKPVCGPDGQVRSFLSTMKDVTHLQVLRDAKLLEARYGPLLEFVPDAIVIVNAAGRIVLANSQAERMFAYAPRELLGRPVEVLLPERFRASHLRHRGGYFVAPRARTMGAGLALYGQRKDGNEFPVEISLSPMATDEGTMVVSALRDVTERRRIEQSLQEANRLKSEFLANMSHELRTPLNGILGFSELLVDGHVGALNARQKEYLEDILGCGRHLLQLINDVLDLSKIEAGRMEVYPEAFDVREAVDDVCDVIAAMAQRKRISLRRHTDMAPPEVRLDRQKLRQVLFNLLSNAVKFTDEGGRVEAAVAAVDGQLCMEVIDTGIGIHPHQLPDLFRAFQQLDSGSARRYEGTGLGLALTRKLVELQGGRIEVESVPGQGSTFRVWLPLALDR